MIRRSRNGCIDCKRAKVKCDEVRPACGTCQRRGYECRGYPTKTRRKDRPVIFDPERTSQRRVIEAERICDGPADPPEEGPMDDTRDIEVVESRAGQLLSPVSRWEASEVVLEDIHIFPQGTAYTKTQTTTISHPRSVLFSGTPLYSIVPTLPPGVIKTTDQPGVETYFTRHAVELVISPEFIIEMNVNVLQVFHEDPPAIADTLGAIGQLYLGGKASMVPVLDRKQRILGRLRGRRGLEQMLLMFLGLCALEMIDLHAQPADISIPAIISNAAIIIRHHQLAGTNLSSVSKYFIRALARQDMIISLTHARRPLIPYSAWLSEDVRVTADRFMGYTGTLMPILADLGALAEEIRHGILQDHEISYEGPLDEETWSEESILDGTSFTLAVYRKAFNIRQRLNNWRPTAATNIAFSASRNLLFHAHSYRAAALLYLHRLLSPPGSSNACDEVALGMAHEVLLHLSAMTDQLKTALWPVLIAATELTDDCDRELVLGVFEKIKKQRGTITATRTMSFCVERVWSARDNGEAWNWMDLVDHYPGECLPI